MNDAATNKRFPPIAIDAMTAAQKKVADELTSGPRGGVRGPFNALMRNPALADRVRQLGDIIRFENSLSPALREFAILITARFWSARYEWHAHRKIALDSGVDESVIDAIGKGEKPASMDPDQAIVHAFCTELLNDKDVSDPTYAAALGRFGEPSVLDLLATVGYFGFVSVILNCIRQPVPEGGAQLPELSA